MITANANNIIKRTELDRPMYNSEMDSNLEELKKLIADVTRIDSDTIGATKYTIGLGEVDNTRDLNKPISNATQEALDLKANSADVLKASGGSMSGIVNLFVGSTIPDHPISDKSNKIANTRFVHNAIGVGSLVFYPLNKPGERTLPLFGQAVSRTTYSELFAYLGTAFGSGDGISTFNLPDYRGMFPRFWDNGAGVDPGRNIGTVQNQSIQQHNHYLPTATSGAGVEVWGFKDATGSEVWSKALIDRFVVGTESSTTYPNPLYKDGLTAGTLGTWGSETRPVNISILPCIRY